MSRGRSTPLSLALDLFVFAPLGAAVRARELVPELAEEGRSRVTTSLRNYRAVGELAIGQLRRRSGIPQRRDGDSASDSDAGPGGVSTVPPFLGDAGDTTSAPSSGAEAGASDPTSARSGGDVAGATPAEGGTSTEARSGSAPPVSRSELAIEDYDELSAVQVLPRLSDLGDAELRTLAAYESAHRGRETILGRIDQLLGSR